MKPTLTHKCSGCGSHDTFYKTITRSREWLAWEKEVARRFCTEENTEPVFDVDESREIDAISPGHFEAFLEFTTKNRAKSFQEGYSKGRDEEAMGCFNHVQEEVKIERTRILEELRKLERGMWSPTPDTMYLTGWLDVCKKMRRAIRNKK